MLLTADLEYIINNVKDMLNLAGDVLVFEGMSENCNGETILHFRHKCKIGDFNYDTIMRVSKKIPTKPESENNST